MSQEIYDEVREAASKKIWARGLEFARRKDVKKISANTFCVIESASASDHEVRLDLVDLDWMCSCSSSEDPCEHVAASVIALKLEQEKGIEIEKYSSSKFSVQYELVKPLNKSLQIVRDLISMKDGVEDVRPVRHSILSIVSGRIEGPQISAKSYDLEIDRVLSGDYGARIDGYVASSRAWNMLMPHLEQLTDAQQVYYGDSIVRVSAKKKAAQILEVAQEGNGVMLTLKANPRVVEMFSNGVCLYKGDSGLEIRQIAKHDLPEAIISQLRGGRFFPENEKVELFSKLLPQLKTRFKVVETDIEEKATYEIMGFCVKNNIVGPRRVQTSFHIAYGDPVKAYVDGPDFVCLDDSVPLRQLDKESVKRRQFERDFGYELSKTYEYEEEKLFDWVNKITRFRLPHIGDDLENLRVVGRSAILAKLLGDDDITFNVEVEEDQVEVGAEDLLDAYENDNKFLKTEKGYVEINLEWLDEYKDLLRSFVVSKKGKQKKGVSALERLRILEGFGFAPPKKLKAYKENLFKSDAKADFDRVQAELRSYQTEGVDWLFKLKEAGLGALLADDMGLGKTLQSISIFDKRTLVICPTSLVFNWKNELAQFRPELKSSVYHGAQRVLDDSADIVITTYGILRTDVEKLKQLSWKIVCIDEAQVIKNPMSKASQALWEIDSDFKLALTGTPIENHYKDLWSIFNFIAPGLLGELSYFEKFVVKPIQGGSDSSLKDLKSRVNPFILRRTKKDVLLELPDKTEVVNYCELTEEQAQFYEDYMNSVKTKMSGEEVKPIQIFELILRLRQFACDPRLVNPSYTGGSGKIDQFKSLISEVTEEKHKSLVFSQWTSFLDLIEKELDALGIKTFRLDGSTRNRQEIVEAYNAESEACVFLLSLKAGGVGLNLTTADHVFLMDPWWNPATERQAIDRAHRIGQKNPVMIHRLVGKNTIEEKVVKLQKIKEEMSSKVLEDMDQARISQADLMSLLE